MRASSSHRPTRPPSEFGTWARSSHPTTKASIQDLLENGFPLMTFPSDLEDTFQRETLPDRERHFLVSGLISVLIYNGFLLADRLLIPDVFWLAALLRILVFTPFSLLLLYLCWRGIPPLRRWMPWSQVDLLTMLVGAGGAISLAIVIPLSNSPMVHFFPVGYMIVITYGNVVSRMRFWFALTFTAVMLGIFSVGVMSVDHFPPQLLWPISAMVVAVALFTLCANYFMERDERRRFLRTLRERSLVQELTEAHARLQDISLLNHEQN